MTFSSALVGQNRTLFAELGRNERLFIFYHSARSFRMRASASSVTAAADDAMSATESPLPTGNSRSRPELMTGLGGLLPGRDCLNPLADATGSFSLSSRIMSLEEMEDHYNQ